MDELASVDPGPKDHQHDAIPPGSQELERIPDVLRRFRSAAAWRTTAAQDSKSHATKRRQGAVAKAQGPGLEAGGPPVGRRRRFLFMAREASQLQVMRDLRQ